MRDSEAVLLEDIAARHQLVERDGWCLRLHPSKDGRFTNRNTLVDSKLSQGYKPRVSVHLIYLSPSSCAQPICQCPFQDHSNGNVSGYSIGETELEKEEEKGTPTSLVEASPATSNLLLIIPKSKFLELFFFLF